MDRNALEWVDEEVGTSEFGDERLSTRYQKILVDCVKNPGALLNQTGTTWYEAKAAYRFMQNAKVSPDKILMPHIVKTAERGRAIPVGRQRRVRRHQEVSFDRRLVAHVASIEQLQTVERRVLRNAIDFEQQLRDFGLKLHAVADARKIGRSLDRQAANPPKDVEFGAKGSQRDLAAVGGGLKIPARALKSVGLNLQVRCDGVRRRVVRGGLNAQARRELR